MLAYTAKAVIKAIHNYAKSRSFTLVLSSKDKTLQYSFDITKEHVKVTYTFGNAEISHVVADIDTFSLPDEVVVDSLIDITQYGEKHSQSVQFEAQLFVILFRLMGDHIFLMIEKDGQMLECRYIDKKLFIVEQTDDTLTLRASNLFRYHKDNGKYEVRVFGPILSNVTPASYKEEVIAIAETTGKQFIYKEEA